MCGRGSSPSSSGTCRFSSREADQIWSDRLETIASPIQMPMTWRDLFRELGCWLAVLSQAIQADSRTRGSAKSRRDALRAQIGQALLIRRRPSRRSRLRLAALPKAGRPPSGPAVARLIRPRRCSCCRRDPLPSVRRPGRCRRPSRASQCISPAMSPGRASSQGVSPAAFPAAFGPGVIRLSPAMSPAVSPGRAVSPGVSLAISPAASPGLASQCVSPAVSPVVSPGRAASPGVSPAVLPAAAPGEQQGGAPGK